VFLPEGTVVAEFLAPAAGAGLWFRTTVEAALRTGECGDDLVGPSPAVGDAERSTPAARPVSNTSSPPQFFPVSFGF
jgi:hypothetical protein